MSRNKDTLAERLVQLFDGLDKIITGLKPDEVAVEETFVNVNATSTLKLGQARGRDVAGASAPRPSGG